MRNRRTVSLVFAFLAVGGFVGAALYQVTGRGATTPLAYVAVAANNHVQVVDLASGRSVRKIYSGAAPWRLVPSPDRRRLWIQHWYAGTTAIVDLESHEIVALVPSRGPGTFTIGGDRFVSFDWPSSALRSFDPQTLRLVREQVTEVRQVYDVVPDSDGKRLYLAQFDPLAQGPRERYSYVVAYPFLEKDPARAAPVSYRTGRSPAAIRIAAAGAFLLTADRETNGLSLINRLGDGRAIPSCAAPQAILLAPDETRMVVACWRGAGSPRSRVISYRTDFGARPWPTVVQEASEEVTGGLVAGAFSPAGDRVYLVDRSGGRLLELEPATLRSLRDLPVGDEPIDVVVLDRPVHIRDRVAAEESQARRQLKAALANGAAGSRPTGVVAWTETARWTKAPPVQDGGPPDAPAVETSSRPVRSYLLAPDTLRTETEHGAVRLTEGGRAVAVDPSGRFWVAPRQNLIATVLALPFLAADEAIRRLAGDVPGSPFLRGGIAVDVVREISDGAKRSLLVGATNRGERAAQLWIDPATGRPASVVEQFPIFGERGHGPPELAGIVETKLHDFASTGDVRFPARLERIIDGRWSQEVRIENVAATPDFPAEKFDLARLGGVAAPISLVEPKRAGGAGPRAVPIQSSAYMSRPGEPHPPYNSNPPTSGPRLRTIADWGVHRVPVPLELQVHNLEHGGVLIQYNCPSDCPDLVRRLEELVRGRDHVLLAPYPWMTARIALTAWGQLDTLDDLDGGRIRRFIEAYAGKDHHAKAEQR